jgi:intraflagellar transport protein 81
MTTSPRERDIEEKIVDLLREHFGLNFTLYQFSETGGKDLLELLNTVLHNVSEMHPDKLGSEKTEATVYRISEFLRTLKYDFPCEPEEWDVRLAQSDKQLIHPLLYWLLQDLEATKKNAYKARYSEEVPIPEEIRVDTTVNEMIVQHGELRERFVQVLEEHDVLGETNVDSLKKQIADLETNKARIATKITGFKRQLGRVKNLDELLKWTGKLRQETDREMRLKEQLQRLSDDKRTLLARQEEASRRLRNAKGDMESRLESLKSELASLKAQSTPGTADEKGLAFCQHQVVAANKRLETKKKQLQDLQKARAEAEQSLQERQADGPLEIPSPAQFQQYVKNLKQKNENYRDLQAQLAVQRKELAVVLRTQEIVNAQREQVRGELARIERQRGVGGFREAREQLEKVSATKADLDDVKGKTLEEMSAISKDIQRSIQARQAELKPLVSKLQDQRKKAAAVESKYLQAKQRHQNAVSEYDTACLGLEEDSKKLRGDIAQLQSKFHTVNAKLEELNRAVKRAKEEQNAQTTGNTVSRSIKTYSDYFQKAARQLKKETQGLKDEKKALGSQSEANRKQLEAFQSLRRLLQVKLECLRVSQKEKADRLAMEDAERKNPQQKLDIES